MILTDREIQLGLSKQQIFIDPTPTQECYSSTSVDLRLVDRLNTFDSFNPNAATEITIDPTKEYNAEREIKKHSKEYVIGIDGFILNPNRFVLGWTLEKVHLPPSARIAARVEGKSSLARLGLLVHITAPTIHSGFDNLIRLELVNLGTIPIRLRKDMRICQLIFELTLGTPAKGFEAIQTS
ncbi:MAG: dCTP deaminase [Roseiarcus sp.]